MQLADVADIQTMGTTDGFHSQQLYVPPDPVFMLTPHQQEAPVSNPHLS